MLMNRKKAEEEFDRVFGSKHQSEKSVRTEYREKRIRLIRGSIAMLIDMLLMPRKNLEKIPLSFFKEIKNSIAGELYLEKESERYMHERHI